MDEPFVPESLVVCFRQPDNWLTYYEIPRNSWGDWPQGFDKQVMRVFREDFRDVRYYAEEPEWIEGMYNIAAIVIHVTPAYSRTPRQQEADVKRAIHAAHDTLKNYRGLELRVTQAGKKPDYRLYLLDLMGIDHQSPDYTS